MQTPSSSDSSLSSVVFLYGDIALVGILQLNIHDNRAKTERQRGWQIFISKSCSNYWRFLFEFKLFLLPPPSILVRGVDLQSTISCLKMSSQLANGWSRILFDSHLIFVSSNNIFIKISSNHFSDKWWQTSQRLPSH